MPSEGVAEPLLGLTDLTDVLPPAADDDAVNDEVEFTTTITRSSEGQGLGLVFDPQFVVTLLLPGCAAVDHGGFQIGDKLVAVDGVELTPGDNVKALFPVTVMSFELRMSRPTSLDPLSLVRAASAAGSNTHVPFMMRMALRREVAGKFDPTRRSPVFQEVVWNEYCVLFPDGSSAPFNEAVRYTALTGYLRKKPVVTDGRAEWALMHGESQRGWARHFCHLSMKQLAWFDEDPQLAMDRQRAHIPSPCSARLHHRPVFPACLVSQPLCPRA